nr:hypothetical protein [Tanacetum cinerariifolium]
MSWFSRCSWCGGKTIPLPDIISQLPSSIVITTSPLVLPIEDPEDSLIMSNKELSTIPEKKSDEVIKSSVENFVSIPSESDDIFKSYSECDLPSCDDFSPINVPEGKSVTFSNPLFDLNDDFTSSDDESLSSKDILKDNVKIYSNPLFKFDDEYISCDVNPHFDEVLEDNESKDSYYSNLDEPALLVTSLFDSNEDECFDPRGDVDEINAFDIPLDFEDSYYDSEGDVLYLESLLSVDTTPNLPSEYSIDHQEDLNQQQMNNVHNTIEDKMKESHNELLNMLKLFYENIFWQRKQAANLSITKPSGRLHSFCYENDDDDGEKTIPLNDIISQLPPSIVITTSHPVLPIEDLEVSLIMGNKELSTIVEKESNEFIKSSVEDLVPIPSESVDSSGSDSECILPSCDDFASINVFEEKAVTFSNPLFTSNDDFTSSDEESLSDEDVLEDIECKDSYDSNLDESTFLVTPLFDSNEDEYFTPGDDIELLLHRDPSTPIMSVVCILKGFTDERPLKENDDLFDLEYKENEWKKILYDAPINDLMIEDKVFDPEIHNQIFFSNICELTLYGSIFDPSISAFRFSHQSGTFISFNVYRNILNESPMEIFPSTCFTLNITMIWGESS